MVIEPGTNEKAARARVLEPGVSVVVPVYNSEESVGVLVSEVIDVLSRRGGDFEIVLVNDGSVDDSWGRIVQLSEGSDRIHGINLGRNFGQHNATLCGIRHAMYNVSITMDDDLQHPPHEIPTLLDHLSEDWDVVYGVPKKRRHSIVRNSLTWMTKSLVGKTTGLRRVLAQSPFRAFRTRLRMAFADYAGPDILMDVLLSWGTTSFLAVPVDHHSRLHGKTTYSLNKLFDMGVLVLTGYSTAPLRFASWVGFGLTAFGIGVLTYVVILALFFGSVPGFPFLASLISIFSGAQLFALGLFGEYLTRIFNRALGRPTYVIKELVGDRGAQSDGATMKTLRDIK